MPQETNNIIPPPSWLNPAKKLEDGPNEIELLVLPTKDQKILEFLKRCYRATYNIAPTLDNEQATGIIANFVVETGHGLKHRGNNLGGWKINKQFCLEYKRTHNGEEPMWWERAGHIEAGDPPMCYYQVFDNYEHFITSWLERFVPANSDEEHRYHKTGIEFHNNFSDPYAWFRLMVKAGYKGPVRALNPQPSVQTFEGVVNSIKRRLAQGFLNLEPDGVWGKESKVTANNKSIQEIFDKAANALRPQD